MPMMTVLVPASRDDLEKAIMLLRRSLTPNIALDDSLRDIYAAEDILRDVQRGEMWRAFNWPMHPMARESRMAP